MLHDLIDDEVRKSFPGLTDEEIYKFYVTAKNFEVILPSLFESDISHARIIRELGWDAFKEYLMITTGTDILDDDDIVQLTIAASYLREIENTTLYAAIYGAASEATSKKTSASRKESYKSLTSQVNNFEIVKGV
jgi:hypothetical protein